MNTNHARDLRKVLEENKFLTLPGVYDCLSARIAEGGRIPGRCSCRAGRLPTARLGGRISDSWDWRSLEMQFSILCHPAGYRFWRMRTMVLKCNPRPPTPEPCTNNWGPRACRLTIRCFLPRIPPKMRSWDGRWSDQR